MATYPAYVELLKSGELAERAARAWEMLSPCTVCAKQCKADRLGGVRGVCGTLEEARLASYGPHLGEEDPLRGWCGSGTIFFAGCNLRCQYCQNHDISQGQTAGKPAGSQELAAVMLELQEHGCHNINLVSPSHVVPQILAALLLAAQGGLRLPLVYNTGGYDTLETLALLDGVVDIYMPDIKYASQQIARHYSKIRNYPQINQSAVTEMHRQVGDLKIDERGIARRGLLIRHLVLPNGLSGTANVAHFLAEEISPNTYINLMDQYRPAYNAALHPKLKRPLKAEEYQQAESLVREAGLHRLDRRRLPRFF